MSQATLGTAPYRNSSLFSGYYLDERVTDLEDWDCDEEAEAAFEELEDLWAAEGDLLASYKEDELLGSWIDEVLDILGFDSLPETTIPSGSGYNDRLLFGSAEARRQAAGQKRDGNIEGMYGQAAAVLEAKQWDADFTAQLNETRNYRDASHQIKYYLEHTPERVSWGILTNGKQWRLYGTKDYATETYYEINLPELLETGDLEAFKYFYAFFRPEAFRETAGTTFLDTVWNESETAAQELGADLQDNVFTALRVLGEGFVHTNDLDIDPDDAAARAELKEQSLVLLYRLMFVLYAESRGLIHPNDPDKQSEYDEHFSLDQRRLEIHEAITSGDTYEDYSGYATQIWGQLEDLFRLVDEGEADLGIPPYNGGLFDDDQHMFLADNEVADRYIAEVIHRLGTTEDADGEPVLADYADLDTRHLGSIYEGLLEHEFRIASEEYAAVAEDGGQVWKPATEVSVAEAVESVEAGELYVVNDEGERKATGAYYTPDYVVSYIVEETIDPLLDEIRSDLEADGLEPGDRGYFGRFYQRVLDLKILDPAMGSAHFLTSATAYLTEQVMEVAREQEQQGRNEQALRRTIAKECIYGVDINGMAVELGKLSMWLETLAADQPLAFLDHHLKAGNSLVGSDITEVLADDAGNEDGQLTLMQSVARARRQTLEHVMDLMAELLAIDNESLADIKSMEEIYDEIRSDKLYQRLFEIANVHTAEQFGLDVPRDGDENGTEDAYRMLAEAIEDDDAWADVQEEDWFRTAQTMAYEEAFFHWELEFPEVFFDADGEKRADAGFDAVVGNPPWGADLGTETVEYMSGEYSLPKSANDTFAVFTKLSLQLARYNGGIGYILPSGWQTSDKYADFREWLVHTAELEKLVNLPYDVFSDAYVDSSVFVLQNTSTRIEDLSATDTVAQVINYDRKAEIDKIERESGSRVDYSRWFLDHFDEDDEYEFVSYLSKDELDLEEKIAKNGIHLSAVADIQRGITPFDLVDDGDDNYSPALDGNLRRYTYGFSGEKYVEYHDGIAEYKPERYFTGERLILRELISRQFRIQLALTDEDFVTNKSYQSILVDDDRYDAGYLLSVLNSKLLSYFHVRRSAVALRDDFPKIVLSETRSLPVPEIDFDTQTQEYPSSISPTQIEIEDGVVNIAADGGGCSVAIRPDASTHDLLATLARSTVNHHKKYRKLNTSLSDHLGNYRQGQSLTEIGFAQPPEGAGDSILHQTAEQKPNLRVGEASVERDSANTIRIQMTARYKPDREAEHQTDRWGYTETEPLPALRITDLTETEADLIEVFVPIAVDKADGFANFRGTATKTNSLIDRLRALTLPIMDDVREGLKSYIQTKQRADELERQIVQMETFIDEIIYELFGVTDDEISLVEEAVDTLGPSLRAQSE
ncbi:Eco57I restriction-modification methylase domain-containing protein [Halorientalis regularis]|uniref:site-specific DNA-methyltransferase (adenine-specific) n=1 Tax=Halorientalis regularis TaxID=660518 RepID=A0A1G7SMA6_9EURY|nr:N-6 DNA methylase [Halorientalis regularis]SDG24071.1 N-6 DNA Methylase [Halorientalis regularis]